MIEQLLAVYDKNLDYAQRLVADVPEARMAVQPTVAREVGGEKEGDGQGASPASAGVGGMNHAAWVIGHLARTADFALSNLNREMLTPPDWNDLLGGQSTPTSDRSRYPDKASLLEALEAAHEAVGDAVRGLDAADLEQSLANERARRRFGTLGQFLIHVMIGHEQMHLGQLSAWRRVQGLPAV